MKNSEKKDNKRRVVLIFLWAIIVILICVSASFAYMKINVTTDKEQVVESGCLKLSLSEKDEINLNDAMPISDVSGMNSKPYTFSVTNTCSLPAKYVLSLNLLSGTNIADSSRIKIAVNGDLTLEPELLSNYTTNYLNDKPNNVIKSYYLNTSVVDVGESNTYDLRMWIDYSATELSDFEAKVMVEAVVDE